MGRGTRPPCGTLATAGMDPLLGLPCFLKPVRCTVQPRAAEPTAKEWCTRLHPEPGSIFKPEPRGEYAPFALFEGWSSTVLSHVGFASIVPTLQHVPTPALDKRCYARSAISFLISDAGRALVLQNWVSNKSRPRLTPTRSRLCL